MRQHSPAALRQMVGPPAHEASKLLTSMAPSAIRSRMPLRVVSLWPAATASPVWIRTSRIQRRSLVQRQGSSNQRMSRSATRRPNSTAWQVLALVGVDHEREVGAGGLTRGADPVGVLLGVRPPTLNLTPREPLRRSPR